MVVDEEVVRAMMLRIGEYVKSVPSSVDDASCSLILCVCQLVCNRWWKNTHLAPVAFARASMPSAIVLVWGGLVTVYGSVGSGVATFVTMNLLRTSCCQYLSDVK